MAALFATAAEAQTFCRTDRIQLCPGCEATFNWYVVLRPAAPGAKSAPFCGINFNGLSTFSRPIEITQKPTLGVARTVGFNAIEYVPKKVGQDTLTFVLHGNEAMTGKPIRSTATMKIHVLDKPM